MFCFETAKRNLSFFVREMNLFLKIFGAGSAFCVARFVVFGLFDSDESDDECDGVDVCDW